MLASRKQKAYSNKIHAIDLFCGAGGLTHGLEKAKISVKLGVDTDPDCRYAYEKNNGAKFLEMGVERLRKEDLLPYYKDAKYKLLVGCPPCQPFSIINKSRNSNDARWGLLEYFLKLVKEISPDFISVENVPPARGKVVFREFIKELEEIGYNVFEDVVNCADYGLPQRRRRLIILASKRGKIKLIPKEEFPGDKKTVRDAIGNLPELEHGMKDEKDHIHWTPKLSELNLERIEKSKPGKSWDIWPKHLIAKCHRKKSGKYFKSPYGRMSWDEVSPTITTYFSGYNNGRFGHPEQDRVISFREGAILQGFPPNYKLYKKSNSLTRASLSRLIGNAVPVNMAEAIGISLIQHVKEIENGKKRI